MMVYRATMDGQELIGNVHVANTFIKRLKGLLFEKDLPTGQGLLIDPCSQIHTIGMKFNIDVVFLSKAGEVIHTEMDMAPGVVSSFIPHSQKVLELKCGTIEKRSIIKGNTIVFDLTQSEK